MSTALNSIQYDQTTRQAAQTNLGLTASLSGTSSWAITASYIAPSVPYTTIFTSSLNWITCSLAAPEQYVNITLGYLYNFTHSNMPPSGQVANTTLYFNNTAIATSSLLFPATWKFLGVAPTYITASKIGVLSLKAFGDGTVLASMTTQY